MPEFAEIEFPVNSFGSRARMVLENMTQEGVKKTIEHLEVMQDTFPTEKEVVDRLLVVAFFQVRSKADVR